MQARKMAARRTVSGLTIGMVGPQKSIKQLFSGLVGLPHGTLLLAFPCPVVIAELGAAQCTRAMFSLVLLPQ